VCLCVQVYNCFTDMIEDASGTNAPMTEGKINVRFRRLQADEDRSLATCNILVMVCVTCKFVCVCVCVCVLRTSFCVCACVCYVQVSVCVCACVCVTCNFVTVHVRFGSPLHSQVEVYCMQMRTAFWPPAASACLCMNICTYWQRGCQRQAVRNRNLRVCSLRQVHCDQ